MKFITIIILLGISFNCLCQKINRVDKLNRYQGYWKIYFPTGNAGQKNNVKEGFFYNDMQVGVWITRTYEGIILEERIFYDTNENKVHVTRYYLNGNKASSGFYFSHPFKDTITVFDIKTKSKKKIYTTTKLMKKGKWSYFYENGVLESEGYYLEDMKYGVWNYYNDRGELIKTENN